MSPHEFNAYRERFDAAAAVLGWTRHVAMVEHKRDSCPPWERPGWLNREGKWLFAEEDLSEAMAEEIIRLAGLLERHP